MAGQCSSSIVRCDAQDAGRKWDRLVAGKHDCVLSRRDICFLVLAAQAAALCRRAHSAPPSDCGPEHGAREAREASHGGDRVSIAVPERAHAPLFLDKLFAASSHLMSTPQRRPASAPAGQDSGVGRGGGSAKGRALLPQGYPL